MGWDPLERLSDDQRRRLGMYEELLAEINQRINLISREDEGHIWDRHILHCLTLTRKQFPDGAGVVDWGTGGGLPAVPLAIAFPSVHFVAVDAVGKKVRAVRSMARRLDVHNLDAWHGRAERFPERAHYSVSRATAPLRDLWAWHTRIHMPHQKIDSCWMPGLICLKGGDLDEEINAARAVDERMQVIQYPLRSLLNGAPSEHASYEEKVILECYIEAD